MADEEIPPLKRCSKCGEEKPATAEFFYRHSCGLRGECKSCLKLRVANNVRTNPEAESARRRRLRASKPDVFRRREKERRDRNKSKILESGRRRYREKTESDPHYQRNRVKRWRKRNPIRTAEIGRVSSLMRRSKPYAAAKYPSKSFLKRLISSQRGRCWWCGKVAEPFEVDHRIPLARGGDSSLSNLVLSCRPCNRSKGAKMPWEMKEPRLL